MLAALFMQPAQAAACGPTEQVFTILQATHNEVPEWGGRHKRSSLVMTVSPSGSWSILEFMRPNVVCILRSGRGAHFYRGEPPKISLLDTAPS